MKLLTKEIQETFRKTGKQNTCDPTVICKFFDPTGSWTYFATEYNPDDKTVYGYVWGVPFPEWGYSSLPEIERVETKFGLKIERDRGFRSCKFSEIKK